MIITRGLRISGRVQGVWFRESMRQQAAMLKVTGWVRNRSDGTVEAVVQGDEPAVEALIAWARRGPENARVGKVEVTAQDESVRYEFFEKYPTL
ncbi:MAG TPA: acylphosphatase [Burkholderiales bacterium]|nr:acylphosphatase [Burkholderiales bacterium]